MPTAVPLVANPDRIGKPANRRQSADSIRWSGLGLLVAVCGAMAPIKLSLVGDLFVPELLLPLVALVAASRPGAVRVESEAAFKALLAAGMVTFAGYVFSDILQGSRPDQFLRGWGRVALVISDFVCLSVILCQDRRNFWWYSMGGAIGNIAYLGTILNTPLSKWKFGYAEPVAVATAAMGAFVSRRLLAVFFSLLGIYSMWSDFRSFSAFCLAVAAILWAQPGNRTQGTKRGVGTLFKLLLATGVAGAIVVTTLSMTAEQSASRRAESNSGRGAAIEVGIKAILRSPVVGYGSWGENKELVDMYLKRQSQLMEETKETMRGHRGRLTVFTPHSQILHAWVEGGILGAAFMLTLLYYLVKTSYWLVKERPLDRLTALLLLTMIIVTFNLFMSPFAAPHRLGIAMGAALVVMLQLERRQQAGASMADAVAGRQVVAGGKVVAEMSLPYSPAVLLRKSDGLRLGQRSLRRKSDGNTALRRRRTSVDGSFGSSSMAPS